MKSIEQNSLVFFVDDDGESSASLIRALRGLGLSTSAACEAYTSATNALAEFEKPAVARVGRKNKLKLDVAVIDLSLEKLRGIESGFELLNSILRLSPDTRVIVLTGHGNEEYGIRALQAGAANFLEKPASPQHLLALIRDGITQFKLRSRVRELELQAQNSLQNRLVGTSTEITRLRAEMEFLATNSLAVFLRGETGVGKSFFALCLHQISVEKGYLSGNFVSYTPRAGGADLISSDLFGHVKGAFTGATENKNGLLHHASGGTLFLDEVDELPTDVQVTLLTVLQDRRYRPVGAARDEQFTGRIVSASNEDYEASQRSGKLRADFFHRLAQEIVIIPPLRDRTPDIEPLAQAFLEKCKQREPTSISGFDAGALQALKAYSWPGNIRELEKAIERGVARAAYERQVLVRASDLPATVINLNLKNAGTSFQPNLETVGFAERIEAFKVKLIDEALAKNENNQLQAAASLGLDRSTLRRIQARGKKTVT